MDMDQFKMPARKEPKPEVREDGSKQCRIEPWAPPKDNTFKERQESRYIPKDEAEEIKKEKELIKTLPPPIIQKREPVQKIDVRCIRCNTVEKLYPGEFSSLEFHTCQPCIGKMAKGR